ncbi:hypothetical protein PGR03_13630 [Klebsiella sp. 141196]|uniref:hypothetical protein n=1 Tax=Klebsiella TaxID=570 RepID=UPI00378A86EA
MSKKEKIKAPMLFGVVAVNDVYCDIHRNTPRENETGINIWLPAITENISSSFLVTSRLIHSAPILFMGLAVIFISEYNIYILRTPLTPPKQLIIRLNRKQQWVYIQDHDTCLPPSKNLSFWFLALFMLSMIIADAYFSHWVLRTKPDTP